MFTAGMSHEQLLAALQAQAGEMTAMRGVIDQLNLQQQQQSMQQPMTGAQGGRGVGGKGNGMGFDEGRGMGKRVILDQKYFQRVDKFEGNPAKFKSWIFDLLTSIGSIDSDLAKDLRKLLKDRPKLTVDERGVFEYPGDFEEENHIKYKGELYALIVALTAGEAKCVVRGISEKNWEPDGYLAICMLQARYDANTAARLLQCVMEVVNLPALKKPPGNCEGGHGVGGKGGWAENETQRRIVSPHQNCCFSWHAS